MWKQQQTQVLVSVLKDTANCRLTNLCRIRTTYPSHWEGSEAAAEQEQRWQQNVLYDPLQFTPSFSPLQLFLEEHSIGVKMSVAKPGIKTACRTLLPFQASIRSHPGAWRSARLSLAAPGVRALPLNLQPSVASWRAGIFFRREQGKE